MRLLALACLLFALSACKKFDGGDIVPAKGERPVWVPQADTIPDNATFTLKLIQDSINSDETAFIFDHQASTAFSNGNGAPYFPGFGRLSLASITSDGRDMSIYDLPYKSKMCVGLDIHSKKDGVLSLKISREKNIPSGIRIWVKDAYAKDSLNLCKDSYSFRITRADTNSFGKKRLKLVLVSIPGE